MSGKTKGSGDAPELIEELRELGRQLGRTLEASWRSEERKQAEREIREGARAFAEELGRAWERTRAADRADVGARARRATAEWLRSMSAELGDLADRFTPIREDPGTRDPE